MTLRSPVGHRPAAVPARLPSSLAPGPGSPVPDISSVKVRRGFQPAIVHDGTGHVIIISVEPPLGAPSAAGVPLADLNSLLTQPIEPLISVVQVVIQLDRAAGGLESGIADAYRNLGYHRFPRSRQVWVALRHDPADTAASASPGTSAARESLPRSLGGRGEQAAALLARCGLRTHVLTAGEAGAMFADVLVPAGPPADGTRQHLSFQVRRWPADELLSIQRVLAAAPVDSARIVLTLQRMPHRPPAMTGMIDVTFDAVIEPRSLARYLVNALSSCGTDLLPGRAGATVTTLAALPLGRSPDFSGRRAARARSAKPAPEVGVIPAIAAGLVIGPDESDDPVTMPLSALSRGTRVYVAAHPALPRLLALRALATGARVRVITSRPDSWLRLGRRPDPAAERITVVSPGAAPPVDGTRASPWMIIDDTGSASVPRGGAWHCVVIAALDAPASAAALADLDMVAYEQIAPAALTTVSAIFGLAGQAPAKAPRGCLAVAMSGSIRMARLQPDALERDALARSLAVAG